MMQILQMFFASMVVLLVVFANQTHSGNFMQNGKEYDDKFYAMFTEKAPVNNIIKLAVSWNAEKQLNHFKQLYHHIEAQDEFSEYAQSIVDATRIALQRSLDQVGYKKKMTLEQYLLNVYQIQNGMRSQVQPDVLEGIEMLDNFSNEEFEKLLDEGEQEEVQWELDNLYPFKDVPKGSEKADSIPKSQQVEGNLINSQKPLILDTQISDKPTSAEPVKKPNELKKTSTPETQESGKSILVSQEADGKLNEDPEESVEEIVAERN